MKNSSSSSSSSRPISSPGRASAAADKFRLPLMRFLRTRSSRSRRISRTASPLFSRYKKTHSAAVHEPSSPKVTCMGQVRVRRPKSGNRKRKPGPKRTRCHCIIIWRALLFKPVKLNLRRPRWRWYRPNWRRWVLLLLCGSVKMRSDSSRNGSNSNRVDGFQEIDGEDDVEEREEATAMEKRQRCLRRFPSPASTPPPLPPKNALLLTRCRSAPYRSSSLAGRFWGEAQETEEEEGENRGIIGKKENKVPTSINESTEQDSAAETRTGNGCDVNLEVCDGNHGSAEDKSLKEEEAAGAVGVRKFMLRRCNSEPAGGGWSRRFHLDKINYLKQRRMGRTESSTPHVHQ